MRAGSTWTEAFYRFHYYSRTLMRGSERIRCRTWRSFERRTISISSPKNGVSLNVFDTGNNRLQKFHLPGTGETSSATSLNPRVSLGAQLGLNQAQSITTLSDFLEERIHVADTGNNRVLLIKLPLNDPLPSWSPMVQLLSAGDIPGALSYISGVSIDKYRKAFWSIGPTELSPVISQIRSLMPVYIRSNDAQYLQSNFPVSFAVENGQWKIMEF
jgi:hypothetical protein